MTEAMPLVCSQEGCPIRTEGRCLENFPGGDGCPHSIPADTSPDLDPEVSHSAVEPAVRAEPLDSALPATLDQRSDPDYIELGGDQSLSTSEADRLAAKYGACVVLFAGQLGSGKTTLISHVYAEFLRGSYCGWQFAGADALMALDARFHGARVASGLQVAQTPRTEEEDMRLLDLRLAKDGQQLSLLLSDIRGEFFDNIAQGSPADEEVPLCRRADKVVLIIDGSKIADIRNRAGEMLRARQVLGGLSEPGLILPGVALAIALTKADCLSDDDADWFRSKAAALEDFATNRGYHSVDLISVAAMPDPDRGPRRGLQLLFQWIVRPRETPDNQAEVSADARSYWDYSNR